MSALAHQAAELFDAVVALTSAAERAAYLNDVCGKNPALRSEVEQLLQHDKAAGSFLEQAVAEVGATGAFTPSNEHASLAETVPMETPGTVIGPYKLLEQIGEGGMGLVFVAEQERPVRRRVALKII